MNPLQSPNTGVGRNLRPAPTLGPGFVNFTVSFEDEADMEAVVNRLRKDHDQGDPEIMMSVEMSLAANQNHGIPLDLKRLVRAPAYEFVHDAFGINRHIDCRTGQLGNHFAPRCAREDRP